MIIIKLRKKLEFYRVKKKIIEVMKKNGLMIAVSGNLEERWIYRGRRFFSRDKPHGVTFEDIWQNVLQRKTGNLYVFVNGKVALDVNPARVLIIKE